MTSILVERRVRVAVIIDSRIKLQRNDRFTL